MIAVRWMIFLTTVSVTYVSSLKFTNGDDSNNTNGNFEYLTNLTSYPGKECQRECGKGDYKICYFKFTIEYYQAAGIACGNCLQGNETACQHPQCIIADGIPREVMSINRRIPGPPIQVCQHDYVIVDVVNKAAGSAVSLHWHGQFMEDTPYMDGVPYVTQCPILYGNTFRYSFYARQAGTHFYHSHSGQHRDNGQYGALIVREPINGSILEDHYDFDKAEHHLFLSDWMHDLAEEHFPGQATASVFKPASILINGRGHYLDPETRKRTPVPPTIYYVKPDTRYRFRVITSISHGCIFQLQIEKHIMSILALDSYNVYEREFDTFISNSGERYDFILHTNHSSGDFWIRVRGIGGCADNFVESFAILRYETNTPTNISQMDFEGNEITDYLNEINEITTSRNTNNTIEFVTPTPLQTILDSMPNYMDLYPSYRMLNHPFTECYTNSNHQCIVDLISMNVDKDLELAKPDYTFSLSFRNYPVPNSKIFQPDYYQHFLNPYQNFTVIGGINNLSLIFPEYPLLTQYKDVDDTKFCDSENHPTDCNANSTNICNCIHRLFVKRNSIVELRLLDETSNRPDMNHPFHLHGHGFMVLDMDHLSSNSKSKNRSRINRNQPLFKDTITVPSFGYSVIRFRANNPGFWILHCHYEWHIAAGMGLIVQVGTPDEMVKAPKDFPQCGNYQPLLKYPDFPNV